MDVCDKIQSYIGRHITFDEPLYNQIEIAGNYLIYNLDDEPVYSGQSYNILYRLGVHRKWATNHYAIIINLESDLEKRLLYEDLMHDKYPRLISNPRNGKFPEERTFDGVVYESALAMYEYIKTNANISSTTARMYIDDGADSLVEVMKRKTQSRDRTTSGVVLSNKKRAGKPLNMKIKTCPYCGVVGSGGNMTRYHFNKCKNKEV